MHNRKHRAGLLIGISCFTLLNLLISAWIIYTQASCCEQSIEIPTLLGLQITAASLLFLLASVTLGVLGYSKFQDLDQVAREQAQKTAKDSADRFFQRWSAD